MDISMEELEVEEISKYSIGEANDGRRQCRSSDLLLPGLIDDLALNCLARSYRSDYASLACVNKRYNQLIKSGDLYGLRKELGIMEYWVYLVFDLRGWEAFDPVRKKWMTIPKMPCDECFNHADKESLTLGSELLVFGRELFDFAIWKYSLICRCWVKCQTMNHPRCLFGKSSLRTIAIVAGGTDKNGNVLKSAELYDSSTGRWEMLPDMHTPRRLCSGFFMGGKFYVMGGMSSPTVSLTCGEEYDLMTKKWRKIEDMYPFVNNAPQAPPLTAVVDDELFAVEYLTNMVKKYDKINNTWSVLGRLPVRADSSNGWGLAFKACGHEILVVGGQRGPEGEGIVLHAWCPKSGITDGSLNWKLHFHAILKALANGIELCAPSAEKVEKGNKNNRGWRNIGSPSLARHRVKPNPVSDHFQHVKAMAVDIFPHCEMVMLLESLYRGVDVSSVHTVAPQPYVVHAKPEHICILLGLDFDRVTLHWTAHLE